MVHYDEDEFYYRVIDLSKVSLLELALIMDDFARCTNPVINEEEVLP